MYGYDVVITRSGLELRPLEYRPIPVPEFQPLELGEDFGIHDAIRFLEKLIEEYPGNLGYQEELEFLTQALHTT